MWNKSESGGAWRVPKPVENHDNLLFYNDFSGGQTVLERSPALRDKLWTVLPVRFCPRVIPSLPPACAQFTPAAPRGSSWSDDSLAELADQLVPVLAQLAVGLHQRADLAARMQHRGVVAAGKRVADLRQAVL